MTIHEANGLLPYVCDSFLRINLLLAYLTDKRSKVYTKNPTRYVLKKTCKDILIIPKKTGNKKTLFLKKEISKIEFALLHELSELMRLGAIVRSIFPPHIDFLSSKNSEPIYLCWHGSEEEVCHWHALDESPKHRHKIQKNALFAGPEVLH